MTTRSLVTPLPLVLALLAGGTLGAQDARLSTRLDARTRDAVVALVDSARAAGLPTEPLVDKALEGASKRAPGLRIVAAVGTLAREMGAARGAIGTDATEAELVAGAGALHAGASPAALARLRRARPGESLTVALGVLADLAARGVPPDSAALAVLSYARTGARDEDFLSLRRDVERDIDAGYPPARAANERARGLPLDRLPATGVTRSGTSTEAVSKPPKP
jgi:hypothetical protein